MMGLVFWWGVTTVSDVAPNAINALRAAVSGSSQTPPFQVVAQAGSLEPELRLRIQDLKEEIRSLRGQNVQLVKINKKLSKSVQNVPPTVPPAEKVPETDAVACPPVENVASEKPLPCRPCPSPRPAIVKQQKCPKVSNCTAVSRRCDQDVSNLNISLQNLKRDLDVCLVEKRGLKQKLEKKWF